MSGKLSPLKKQHLVNLASRFLSLGGMNYTEGNQTAERLHDALARACDHSGAHDEACTIVSRIVPAFNY